MITRQPLFQRIEQRLQTIKQLIAAQNDLLAEHVQMLIEELAAEEALREELNSVSIIKDIAMPPPGPVNRSSTPLAGHGHQQEHPPEFRIDHQGDQKLAAYLGKQEELAKRRAAEGGPEEGEILGDSEDAAMEAWLASSKRCRTEAAKKKKKKRQPSAPKLISPSPSPISPPTPSPFNSPTAPPGFCLCPQCVEGHSQGGCSQGQIPPPASSSSMLFDVISPPSKVESTTTTMAHGLMGPPLMASTPLEHRQPARTAGGYCPTHAEHRPRPAYQQNPPPPHPPAQIWPAPMVANHYQPNHIICGQHPHGLPPPPPPHQYIPIFGPPGQPNGGAGMQPFPHHHGPHDRRLNQN